MKEPALDYLTVPRLLSFHRAMFAYTGARGGYLKQEDNQIAIRGPDGEKRIDLFSPPSWEHTEGLTVGLCDAYRDSLERELAHPLVLLAAFIVDLLAIHPVLDGNGRMARLATTHELMRLDYSVARYVSVEQRIYESKNAYYTALEQSQRNWHEGTHSIWPWAEYLIRVLDQAYEDFENRVAGSRDQAAPEQARARRALGARRSAGRVHLRRSPPRSHGRQRPDHPPHPPSPPQRRQA